jgi:hypothetical protein
MSAESTTANPAGRRLTDSVREAASKYGLIAVLLALPVYLAITSCWGSPTARSSP